MVSQIKGPAIFLAQFIGDQAPFDSLENITRSPAGLGYNGVQIPTIDKRVFDLELAVSSDTYIDEVKGICKNAGVEITELSVHLQGQLLAVSPAYNESFDVFAPEEFRGNPNARTEWAIDQLKKISNRIRTPRIKAYGWLHRVLSISIFVSLATETGRSDRGSI